MRENGYSEDFAETCLNQIKGFSEYGFPESHAASFALLVYASAWIKRHYPAEFACALLNSQPMGFYAPAQIIRDAQNHGVDVIPIDANYSSWDCTLIYPQEKNAMPKLQLGLRLINGLRRDHAEALNNSVKSEGTFDSIDSLWGRATPVSRSTLATLADADAFGSLETARRPAHWQIHALADRPAPLDSLLKPRTSKTEVQLPESSLQREMFNDYESTGLSLKAHPMQFLRATLRSKGIKTAEQLAVKNGVRAGSLVSVAGVVIIRQRPGTAKGVVFITLEDETGHLNLIIRPDIFERHRKTVMLSSALLASGSLQRTGEVIYVDIQSLQGIDAVTSVYL
jgi:error-prone DNA polymerase